MSPGLQRMKTILVADDKAAGRELVRSVLEACGYIVVEACDGNEAVRLARQSRPDLILLDLHMPNMDGFGALKELRGEVGSPRRRSSR